MSCKVFLIINEKIIIYILGLDSFIIYGYIKIWIAVYIRAGSVIIIKLIYYIHSANVFNINKTECGKC